MTMVTNQRKEAFREKRLLEKSWAKYFAENIFPEIGEAPFSLLYSDRPSRHNTPVNVIIGALILKEIFGLTDEEIVDTLPFEKRKDPALPEGLSHYTEEDDHYRVLYHNRSEDTVSKTDQVLEDAALIISACGSRYDEYSEYQLLIRAINEQTKSDADGKRVLKGTNEGMDSNVLQNPADPDATYRKKLVKNTEDTLPTS